MKYLWSFVFNLLGIYILVLFLTGKGGIIENFNKMEKLRQLKQEKIIKEIEIEELKNQIETLKKLKNDENHILLEQGKKKDNTIIFKFIEKNKNTDNKLNTEVNDFSIIYILFGIVICLIIIGNILIFIQFSTKKELI